MGVFGGRCCFGYLNTKDRRNNNSLNPFRTYIYKKEDKKQQKNYAKASNNNKALIKKRKNDNNKGIFLKVPINEFKKQIEAKEEIKEKKVNILNNKLKDTNLLIEKPKIMIVFKTGKGYSYGFTVNYGITVEQLLQKFIKKVKKIDYANISKSKIKFFFNSVKMNENEKVLKTLVEKYFENRKLKFDGNYFNGVRKGEGKDITLMV